MCVCVYVVLVLVFQITCYANGIFDYCFKLAAFVSYDSSTQFQDGINIDYSNKIPLL